MNTLVYGHNGSGKTERIIVKEVNKKIDNNESFLFLDSKEEYYKNYQKELENKNYKVVLINLRKVLNSHCFNPLTLPYTLYNKDRDKSIEVLRNIGRCIFDDKKVIDKFWVNMSCDLFVGLALILFEYAREDAINLFSIVKLLDHDDKFDYVLKTYDSTKPIHMALEEVIKSPKETKESVYTVFRQKLNTYLLYENLSTMLSYTDHNIENIINDKVAIFIINKDENKSISNLANIYISQVYQMIVNEKINYKFNFVLDNLETINRFSILNDMLEVSTSRGFDIIIGIRDIELFKRDYELKDIDVLYNLDIDNGIIKVERNIKKKYLLSDYPKIKLKDNAEYPSLQKHPKYLFNLTKFIDNL